MRLGSKKNSVFVFVLITALMSQAILPPDSHSSSAGDIPRQITENVTDFLWGSPLAYPPDASDFGQFTRGVLISVSGKPFLLSEEDIDRIVGDPWTLNESTEAKLNSLPPRFRLKMYSFFSLHMGSVHPEISGGAHTVTAGQPAPLQITLDDEASKAILSGIGKIFTGHFRTEELIDLAVFALSTEPFFPKNREQWNNLKSSIVHYDMILGLVALLSMATLNKGNLKVSRWFYRSPTDAIRAGAYGSVRNLGLSFHPTFTAGVQLAMHRFDLSLGGIEHIRPESEQEQHALEVVFREHWLSLLSRAMQWEVSATARGKIRWRAGDHERTYEGVASFYARRPQIFRDTGIDFLAEGSASTDFLERGSAELSVGLENVSTGTVGALRFSVSREEDKAPDCQVAVVLGGVTGDSPKDAHQVLHETGLHLRDAVQSVQGVEKRYCEISKELSGSRSREQVQRFRMAMAWMDQALSDLEQRRSHYCAAFSSIDLRAPFANTFEPGALLPIDATQVDQQALTNKERLVGNLEAVCPQLKRIKVKSFGPLSADELEFVLDRLVPSSYYAVDRECIKGV